MVAYVLTATALVLVIEGLLYALFPDFVRKMMALALTLPVARLRFLGIAVAFSGCVGLWILQHLNLL